jgi:hypothetical protein
MNRALAIAFGSCLFMPSVALAHVELTDPPPRNGENGLVAEPCGEVPPTDIPTPLMAGETITVSWMLGQSHGGSLRIDFAEADDMGFQNNILAMDISDEQGMPTSIDVTLPNVDCDQCTLRITQVNPDEDDYVSCADVQLTGATAGSTGDDTTGDGGSTTGVGEETAGPGTDGDDTGPLGDGPDDDAADDTPPPTDDDGGTVAGGDTTTGPPADRDDDSGCGCRTRTPTVPASLLLLGLVAYRRRSRR